MSRHLVWIPKPDDKCGIYCNESESRGRWFCRRTSWTRRICSETGSLSWRKELCAALVLPCSSKTNLVRLSCVLSARYENHCKGAWCNHCAALSVCPYVCVNSFRGVEFDILPDSVCHKQKESSFCTLKTPNLCVCMCARALASVPCPSLSRALQGCRAHLVLLYLFLLFLYNCSVFVFGLRLNRSFLSVLNKFLGPAKRGAAF